MTPQWDRITSLGHDRSLCQSPPHHPLVAILEFKTQTHFYCLGKKCLFPRKDGKHNLICPSCLVHLQCVAPEPAERWREKKDCILRSGSVEVEFMVRILVQVAYWGRRREGGKQDREGRSRKLTGMWFQLESSFGRIPQGAPERGWHRRASPSFETKGPVLCNLLPISHWPRSEGKTAPVS